MGLGTFGSDHAPPAEVAAAVKGAASVGYRHFDCASVYGNEDAVGASLEAIIRSGIKREELWVTSKVWNDKHGEEDVIASCRKSLADLRLNYLDMFLVHWPFPNYHPPGCDVTSRGPSAKPYIHADYMKTWRAMEKLVDLKLVRHIGTSNMTIPKLKLVLRDARIKPAVNEMELHPHFQQPELFRFVMQNGIQPIGFCPLGSPGRPERDRTTEELGADEGSGHRQDRRAARDPSRRRLHQMGGAARPDADPVLGQPAQLRRQSAGHRRGPALRQRDAGDCRDRPRLSPDQGAGLPVEGRADLGRPLGCQRRNHPAVSNAGAVARVQLRGPEGETLQRRRSLNGASASRRGRRMHGGGP